MNEVDGEFVSSGCTACEVEAVVSRVGVVIKDVGSNAAGSSEGGSTVVDVSVCTVGCIVIGGATFGIIGVVGDAGVEAGATPDGFAVAEPGRMGEVVTGADFRTVGAGFRPMAGGLAPILPRSAFPPCERGAGFEPIGTFPPGMGGTGFMPAAGGFETGADFSPGADLRPCGGAGVAARGGDCAGALDAIG